MIGDELPRTSADTVRSEVVVGAIRVRVRIIGVVGIEEMVGRMIKVKAGVVMTMLIPTRMIQTLVQCPMTVAIPRSHEGAKVIIRTRESLKD